MIVAIMSGSYVRQDGKQSLIHNLERCVHVTPGGGGGGGACLGRRRL